MVLVGAAPVAATVETGPHINNQVRYIQPVARLEEKLPSLEEEKQPVAIVIASRESPLMGNQVEELNAHIDWLQKAGIPQTAYEAVESIVSRESHWEPLSWNKGGSGAYGVCQSLPASKMVTAGDDYMTNPVTQLKWCNSYALARYGSWQAAKQYWDSHGWW